MIKITELKLPLGADDAELLSAAAKELRCSEKHIKSLEVTKKAVDSRKKDNIFFVCNVEAELDICEETVLRRSSSKASIAAPFIY